MWDVKGIEEVAIGNKVKCPTINWRAYIGIEIEIGMKLNRE